MMLERTISSVRSVYLAILAQRCPHLLAFGSAVLDRVSPPNWTLEWFLPLWLGETFGLDPSRAHDLVLCNVLGLCHVRLMDDLADGENDGDRAAASELAEVCLQEALAHYRRWFPDTAPFWPRLEHSLSRWRAAGDLPGDVLNLSSRAALDRLAARGAPLHIGADAACLLAGRPDVLPALDTLLDYLLAALVLYDHAADWDKDLEAGRFNTFVHFLTPAPQAAGARESCKRQVLQALFLGDAGAPYFDSIQELLAAALEQSRVLGIVGLSNHLIGLRAEVESLHSLWQAEYRARREAMTARLFGPTYSAAAIAEGKGG